MSRDHHFEPSHRGAPLFDAAIRVDNLPAAGRDIVVETTAEQREAIAKRMKVTAVDRFTATLGAKRFRGGIRVLGHLDAVIEQPCVVSFAPVSQTISEDLDRVFLPSGGGRDTAPGHDAEILIDPEADDEPDRFEGNEVDLSEFLLETLALAIDPYPRAAGASIDTSRLDADGEVSPFSALKALKNPDGDNSP